MFLLFVKCEYISYSLYVVKEQNSGRPITKHETRKKFVTLHIIVNQVFITLKKNLGIIVIENQCEVGNCLSLLNLLDEIYDDLLGSSNVHLKKNLIRGGLRQQLPPKNLTGYYLCPQHHRH